MTVTTPETHERHAKPGRVGWQADEDERLDWIRDVEDPRSWWDRAGAVFAEHHRDGSFSVWVWVPDRFVDRSSLLPWWSGPADLICSGTTPVIARWYPGTSATAYVHYDNPHSRWYARVCDVPSFADAKRSGRDAMGRLRGYLTDLLTAH